MTGDNLTDGHGLIVSTRSVDAATAYARGVDLLVASSPEAIAMFGVALERDPKFGLARAALACALVSAGMPSVPSRERSSHAPGFSTRRERQHVEIIGLVLSGERDRAAVLGREHLHEFPRDIVVAHVLTSYGIV